MKRLYVGLPLAILLLAGNGCRKTPAAQASELTSIRNLREHLLDQRLAIAERNTRKEVPVARWNVPAALHEISGLSLTRDGRVLAHDDEVGTIWVIDPKLGIILKKFSLEGERHGDFEAITNDDSTIYLLESNGKIYHFREGADGKQVPYTVFDTRLGKECEFESMVFEPDSTRLLLVCKKVNHAVAQHELVMYGFHLPLNPNVQPTMITIPTAEVIGENKWKNFHPSDVTIDPFTKNYLIIASHEKAMAIITPDGDVVRSMPLPPGHNQPEGVAITKDSLLLISDEAHMTPGAITVYKWRGE